MLRLSCLPTDDDEWRSTTSSTSWTLSTDDRVVTPTTSLTQFSDDDHDHSSSSSSSDYVEAGTKTHVSVAATAYDERPAEENGCGRHGCLPALAYDGNSDDAESRWSCSEDTVPHGGQCEIEFKFDHPQDILGIVVDFWKGDERTRYLKVRFAR